MSVEQAAVDEGDSVEQLGRELGERIAQTPEYERFEEARAAVQRDEAVQAKIDEFEQIRSEFMHARQTGQASNSDLQRVQEAQDELHSMPVMSAQEELTDTLEAVNEAISDPLAVDFGGEAGGCCQD